MFSQSKLMFLYAITPVHMGAGQALGVIDNPIQRERQTNHPNFAGSGLKGAARHHLHTQWQKTELNAVFGPESQAEEAHAGAVSFGDGQLIAYPVRSIEQGFVYAVSPLTLSRLQRLAHIANLPLDWSVPEVEASKALVCDTRVCSQGNKLILESFEYPSEEKGALKKVANWLADNALPSHPAHEHFREKMRKDLVLLPDSDFSYLVEHTTVVETHVRINKETGTAEDAGLFYTENLPPESLLVSPVFSTQERTQRSARYEAHEVMQQLVDTLNEKPLQIGGDATTGRGQVVLRFNGQPSQGDTHE